MNLQRGVQNLFHDNLNDGIKPVKALRRKRHNPASGTLSHHPPESYIYVPLPIQKKKSKLKDPRKNEEQSRVELTARCKLGYRIYTKV